MQPEEIDKFKTAKIIFMIGIGGSNLAAKAVWNALTLHNSEIEKKIIFLEAPDEREYLEARKLIDEIQNLEDFVLATVSKSGETRETLETFKNISEILLQKFGEKFSERSFVVSTESSTLWKLSSDKGIRCIPWEKNIGGRFSAFTVAHTLVLEIAGLDTKTFIKEGKEMEETCKLENSPAKNLADKIFESYKNGVEILDFFIFNSELEDLGKWCRQLIAESLGKKNKKGERIGIVPTVSIGPTDLHSILQLDLGGPRNRFTIFIKSTKEIDEVMNESSYKNTKEAYEKTSLPFEKFEMSEINEGEIGKFMSLMMQTTISLGELLEVDIFDQPEVEEYKKNLL